MQHIFASMRRLHVRGPACRGLVVDEEGVALGPECILVRRTPHGYRRAGDDKIVLFAREAFGDEPRLRRLPTILAGIAQALNAGDLVRAQLLGLEIPLDELDDTRLSVLHLPHCSFARISIRTNRVTTTDAGPAKGALPLLRAYS